MLVETIAPGFPVSVDLSSVVDAKAIRFANGIGVKLNLPNENFVIVRSDQADQLVELGLLARQLQNVWRP